MKKKKIAILTLYYQNYNYGGLLQAYALQKIIETMGYECKQIAYKRRRRDVFFRKIRVILRMPYIEKKDFVLYYIDKIKRKTNKEKDISNRTIDKFNEFMEIIPHTEVVDSKKISRLINEFDLYVVGSDQVWNPEFTSSVFLFDFLPDNVPRISYAASIRLNKLERNDIKKMKKYLEKFSYISVREKNAKLLLENIGINRGIDVLVDPTMLLKRRDWDRIAVLPEYDFDYIFLYLVRENSCLNQIKEFARRNQLKIVSVLQPGRIIESDGDDNIIQTIAGPREFLGLIKKATYVIPNSFHGTVFSIIYNKQFYTYGLSYQDDRKKTILDEFNLRDRLIDYSVDINRVDWKEIDYETINTKLEFRRNRVYTLLESVIMNNVYKEE